jgi:Putative Se/S carrier protein-like
MFDGFIAFDRVQDAMKAEKFLNAAGIESRAVVPIHQHDTGCNLGIAFDLKQKERVEQILKEKRIDCEYIVSVNECA